jgi:hypothetical protein
VCSSVVVVLLRAADTRMPMLYVAPEGTLGDGRCLLQYKTGAFVAGVPVVPILLRYRLTPHNPAWTVIIPWWHAVSAQVEAVLVLGLGLGFRA